MPPISTIFKEAFTSASLGVSTETTLLSFTGADGFVDGHRYAVFSMLEGNVSAATMYSRLRVGGIELSNFRTRYRPSLSAPNAGFRSHMGLYTFNAGDVITYTADRSEEFGSPSLTVWNAKVMFVDLDSPEITENADWYSAENFVDISNIAKNDWTNHRHISKAWTPDGTSDYLILACTKFTSQTTSSQRVRLSDSIDGVLPGTLVGARGFGATATTEHAWVTGYIMEAPAQVARTTHIEVSAGNGIEGADYSALVIIRLQAFETFSFKQTDHNVDNFPPSVSGSYPSVFEGVPYTPDSGGEAIFFNFNKWPQEASSDREGHSCRLQLPGSNTLYQTNVPSTSNRYRNRYDDGSDLSHLPESGSFYFGKATGMTPGALEQMSISLTAFDTSRRLRHLTTAILGTVPAPLEGTTSMFAQSLLSGLGGFEVDGSATATSTSSIQGDLGTLIQPKVASVVALGANSIRMTFDSPMRDDAALNNAANYDIPVVVGGQTVSVTAATPEAAPFPTYVDLATTEHTDNILYSASVENVVSEDNNLIDPNNDSATYTAIGDKPQLAAVETKSSKLLRLNFSEEMVLNSELTNPFNYTLTPITPGAAQLFFTEVVAPDGDNFPSWVELPVSEMTDGATYEVSVSDTGPTDRALNTMDPGANLVGITGLGTPPNISQVVAISTNRADVVFDEPMKDNASIREAARYTWDNGLATVDVLAVAGDTVQLVTSDQIEGELYTLTMNNP